MLNKKFNLSKRFMLAFAIITIVTLAFAASAFAASYGIDAPSGRITLNPTVSDTVTVPVTGAGENQITIVVRKDNSDWVSDPSANVLYIDQVKGEGERTNIVFGIDTDKWAEDTYKIFVGGSGMDPVSADLVISSDSQPSDVIVEKVYDETANLGQAGKLLVEAKLESGNGQKTITVGGVELLYSTERGLYIGLVDSSEVVSGELPNAVVSETEPTSFIYGDVNGNGTFNVADLALAKNYQEQNIDSMPVLVAGDVNMNGAINVADLALMKNVQEQAIPTFPALGK